MAHGNPTAGHFHYLGVCVPGTVVEKIADALRLEIDHGAWNGTGRLPPERDLAKTLNVSRGTVRGAMRILKDEGLIVRRVGRGTHLANYSETPSPKSSPEVESISPSDVLEVRLILEPSTCAFAATHASAAELTKIREAHLAACRSTDGDEFEQWDHEFHHRIFVCLRNPLLRYFFECLRAARQQPQWFEIKRRTFLGDRRNLYCRQHEAILEALRARDPLASYRAMHDHLRAVQHNLIGSPFENSLSG